MTPDIQDLAQDEQLPIDPAEQAQTAALTNAGVADLAKAIVTAVNDAHGPRKLSFDEYLQKVDTHRSKPQLARKVYQNGIMLQRDQLSADAIEMLNILRPGLYCDGVFTVLATQDGGKMSAIDIRYSNKSIDERMQLKTAYPTFEHMLAAMLKERPLVAVA